MRSVVKGGRPKESLVTTGKNCCPVPLSARKETSRARSDASARRTPFLAAHRARRPVPTAKTVYEQSGSYTGMKGLFFSSRRRA
jgi:hypothetical protein